VGRTPCHRIVHFATGTDPVPLGGVTRVRVEGALSHSLKAERLEAGDAAASGSTMTA
jgi:hypothetical protein